MITTTEPTQTCDSRNPEQERLSEYDDAMITTTDPTQTCDARTTNWNCSSGQTSGPVTAHQDCVQASHSSTQRKRGHRRKSLDRESKLLLLVGRKHLCPISCMKAFERACAEG